MKTFSITRTYCNAAEVLPVLWGRQDWLPHSQCRRPLGRRRRRTHAGTNACTASRVLPVLGDVVAHGGLVAELRGVNLAHRFGHPADRDFVVRRADVEDLPVANAAAVLDDAVGAL